MDSPLHHDHPPHFMTLRAVTCCFTLEQRWLPPKRPGGQLRGGPSIPGPEALDSLSNGNGEE